MSKYTCIFGHYDTDGAVHQYVLTYLRALAKLNMRIIFVSNSRLSELARQALQGIQQDMIIAERHNKGFDFGSWKHALGKQLIPEDTDYLLLTNDSILGPLSDLKPLFDRIEEQRETDVWGLTDSYENAWHLQSFFMCFSRKAFRSEAFHRFFQQDFDNYKKRELIEKGEIGLSVALLNSGFKAQAFSPYKRLDPDVEMYPALSKNPTHYYWDRLITETGFPFIKKELLLQNPENIKSLEDLFLLIRKVSGSTADDIKEFLIDTYNRPSGEKEDVDISVICHLYYPQSIYYILLRLAALKSCNARFYFNISAALRHNEDFVEVLTRGFPGAVVLFSPSQGRDIGGKMVALNAEMQLKIRTGYTLIIHDKLSPHTPLGPEWREKLFKVIDKKNLPEIFARFARDPKIGVIGPKDLIKNEYNPDDNSFRCTSSDNMIRLMEDYHMKLTNYNFVAGTIFWIRSSILSNFFAENHPLSVRASFERGNALDFVTGTNIHAWERIFPLLANAQGYTITGI